MQIVCIYAGVSPYEQKIDYVLNIFKNTLAELDIDVKIIDVLKINLSYYNGIRQQNMEDIFSVIKASSGVIFATTAQRLAPSGAMQVFLEHLDYNLYPDVLKDKSCIPIITSSDNSEYSAGSHISSLIARLGGVPTNNMLIGKDYLQNIEGSNVVQMIERYAEDFCRIVKQNRKLFVANPYSADNKNMQNAYAQAPMIPQNTQGQAYNKKYTEDSRQIRNLTGTQVANLYKRDTNDINRQQMQTNQAYNMNKPNGQDMYRQNPYQTGSINTGNMQNPYQANVQSQAIQQPYQNQNMGVQQQYQMGDMANQNPYQNQSMANINPYQAQNMGVQQPYQNQNMVMQQPYQNQNIGVQQPYNQNTRYTNDNYYQAQSTNGYDNADDELKKHQDAIQSLTNQKEDDINHLVKLLGNKYQENTDTRQELTNYMNTGYEQGKVVPNINSLKQKTSSLPHYFQPQLAKDTSLVMQISVSGNEVFNGYITIKNGECIYTDGIKQSPDVTILSDSDVWRDVLNKKMTLQKAFMLGKLKIKGNFVIIGKFEQYFKIV